MSETTTTAGTEFTAEKFRFIELLLFMLVGIVTQIIWVSFSPIMDDSMAYYGVGEIWITVLAASFMFVYIFVNGPCTKLIDKYGLKNGVGIGVVLTGVGGLIRAIGGPNYWICFVGQIVAAIGQPFVLNSFTKLGSNWFLESEKTTAAGLGSISTFIGVIIAMLFPDIMAPLDMGLMLWIYAIIGLVAMVLYLVFARDKPKSPPNKYADKDQYGKVEGGMKVLMHNKDFVLLSIMVFIGLGAFNVITSTIDAIFNSTAYPGVVSGNISAIMIVGGILGAMIISTISDSIHKRKIFLLIAFAAGVPLSILLGVLRDPLTLYIVSFLVGFTLVSLLPVGTTYGAEITYPIPEEQSNGVLMTVGQISGILFLIVPAGFFMYFMAIICGIGAIIGLKIHDTPWFEAQREKK